MLTKKQVEQIEDRACPWGEAMWNEDGQCVFLADKCSKEEAVKVANYYNDLELNQYLT